MNRELTGYIAWAVGIVVVALAASYARRLGYIDQDTTTRVVIGLNGLMIAWIGNRLPKSVAPSACAARVKRIGGWSMVLSGLVYAQATAWCSGRGPDARPRTDVRVLTGDAFFRTTAPSIPSSASDRARILHASWTCPWE
jgi:hypothetical protein